MSYKVSLSDLFDYNVGAVYVFARIEGAWSAVQKIVASNGMNNELFGNSICVGKTYAFVGAFKHSSKGNTGGEDKMTYLVI